MDDKDKTKVKDALAGVINMEAELSNLLKRGPAAVKVWTLALPSQDATAQAKLKNKVIKPMVTLLKDAKTVLKDLDKLYAECADKKITTYPDAKTFRTKVVTKYFDSSKKLEQDGQRIILELRSILGGGLYPGMGDTDVKVSVNSIDNFAKRCTDVRIQCGKL
ncbi:MAG TPA: hypothetical protein VEQ09_01825 [Aquabacterium sp.]|nr:hypothetical protein [Aquabacterium sp.]